MTNQIFYYKKKKEKNNKSQYNISDLSNFGYDT